MSLPFHDTPQYGLPKVPLRSHRRGEDFIIWNKAINIKTETLHPGLQLSFLKYIAFFQGPVWAITVQINQI